MKKKLKLLAIVCIVMSVTCINVSAQSDLSTLSKEELLEKTLGQGSFFNRDNINSFLRTAINASSFSDSTGSIEFGTSLFKLTSGLFKNLEVDNQYLKRSSRRLRNIEIGLNLQLHGQGIGIASYEPMLKVAIVNNRYLKESEIEFLQNSLAKSYSYLNRSFLQAEQQFKNKNPKDYQKYEDDYASLKNSGKGLDLDIIDFEKHAKLKQYFDNEIRKLSNGIYKKFADVKRINDSTFSIAKERIKRRALLTFDIKASLGEESTKGLATELKFVGSLNPKNWEANPWDLEFSTNYEVSDNLSNETVIKSGRRELIFALNINKVIWEVKNESTLEFKLGTDFTNILEGIMAEEKRNTFNFNAVLTPRLSKNLYAPISLKYDIENQNFLGFLSFSWNIGNKQ